MLLGIWSEKDSAGHKILATLGFDDKKASELAKSVGSLSLLYEHSVFSLLSISLLLIRFLLDSGQQRSCHELK